LAREDKLATTPPIDSAPIPNSILPLHHQLYISLRQRLLDGSFSPGKALPGELKLAEEFGVSRVTLRRTLDSLQNEGLIVRKQGVGTFPGDVATVQPKRGASYGEHVYHISRQVRHELLEFDYIPTPHFLNPAPDKFGPVVLKTVRIGFVRKDPVHLIIGYTPGRLGQLIDRTKLANRPIMEILQKNGIAIDQTELQISASAADPVEATRLGIPIGSPLIRSDRISWSAGKPVDHDLILSRPDMFRYCFISDEQTGTLRPGTASA
jgi:GntR family transcriptional regulator